MCLDGQFRSAISNYVGMMAILIMNGNYMSNHQPAKILCNTTAPVFLMTEDSIQMHRC